MTETRIELYIEFDVYVQGVSKKVATLKLFGICSLWLSLFA